MSTKNLARTVIEGGRTSGSCWSRRHSHQEHRAAETAVLHRIRATGDTDGDDAAFAPLQSVYRSFDDKLGPAKRWLERQVGRPWDAVRSDLFQRFDTRTTPGRHIVFDHMIPWVEPDGFRFSRREFHVDGRGILRKAPHHRYWSSYYRRREPLPRPQKDLERWLGGRRVAERGEIPFWFMPTPSGGFRQDQRLDNEDARLWRSLPNWFRKLHRPVPAPAQPNHNWY